MNVVRTARPPRLYVAADGPRPGRVDEAQRCNEVRAIMTDVDWPCEVRTLFRESNIGCKRAVSGAISWFFEHEEEGIILEDDVVPSPTFFPFCDELLERYRHDAGIMHISADYFAGTDLEHPTSYVFSRYAHIWGWASWRRAWALYDPEMKSWPALRESGIPPLMLDGPAQQRAYWTGIFDAVHAGTIDTWDYQWQFCCWKHGALSAIPAVNLARNIGFDEHATHTHSAPAWLESLPIGEMRFPLRHPADVTRSQAVDDWEDTHLFLTRRSVFQRFVAGASSQIHRVRSGLKRRLLQRFSRMGQEQ
jgi:hypothetical protein